MPKRHIIAIGGASFRAEPQNLAADRYILAQTGKRHPKICFIPTASAEPVESIELFTRLYRGLGAEPSVLRFFQRTPDLRETLLTQDAIYVGGGNTKSMLAVWREWGLPDVLREAWRRGIVLGGVSAGAICWFEHGVTDSWADRLQPLACMGFLKGACCPHYDSEVDRRPSVHAFLQERALPPVLALNDGAAAHFIGRSLDHIVTWRDTGAAFMVRRVGGGVVEQKLPATRLRAYRLREEQGR
ncbi:MAG: peptidase E [Acidobacteria bacterium]|nr:peptidase E [Acidobacteriota bacterium]